MQPLDYTTSVLSWPLIHSAIKQVQKTQPPSASEVDLNLEAPTCIILSCTALEAFINEMSCLASNFLFAVDHNFKEKNEADYTLCQKLEEIKTDGRGSFYQRYKRLINLCRFSPPDSMEKLSHLCKLRNSLIHFRKCEVSVIENNNGTITLAHDPPQIFVQLKNIEYEKSPILDSSDTSSWHLQISTNAMAAWSISQILDAIQHVIENLPGGEYKKLILRTYASRDRSFNTVFEVGQSQI